MDGSQDSFREKTNSLLDELSKLGDVDYDELKNIYDLEDWERIDQTIKEFLEKLLEQFGFLGRQISEATDLKRQIDERLNAESYLKFGPMNQMSIELFGKVNALIDTLTLQYAETIQLLMHSSQYHAQAKKLIRNPPEKIVVLSKEAENTMTPEGQCCQYAAKKIIADGLTKTKILLDTTLLCLQEKSAEKLYWKFKNLSDFLDKNLCPQHKENFWNELITDGLPYGELKAWTDYVKADRSPEPLKKFLYKTSIALKEMDAGDVDAQHPPDS